MTDEKALPPVILAVCRVFGIAVAEVKEYEIKPGEVKIVAENFSLLTSVGEKGVREAMLVTEGCSIENLG